MPAPTACIPSESWKMAAMMRTCEPSCMTAGSAENSITMFRRNMTSRIAMMVLAHRHRWMEALAAIRMA